MWTKEVGSNHMWIQVLGRFHLPAWLSGLNHFTRTFTHRARCLRRASGLFFKHTHTRSAQTTAPVLQNIPSPGVELLSVGKHAVVVIPDIVAHFDCAQALLWHEGFLNNDVV